MQNGEGELAGEQGFAGIGAERDLVDLIEAHAGAADQHRAQRHRTGAADRVDADRLAGDVLAGLAGIGRRQDPVRIVVTEDPDQRHVGIGHLRDHRRGRRNRQIDVAGDDGARRGGAVVERPDFEVDAVFFEEGLLDADIGVHRGENRRNAGQRQRDLLVLCQSLPGRQRRGEAKRRRTGKQQHGFSDHVVSSVIRFSRLCFTVRDEIRPHGLRSSACPKPARAIRQSAAAARSRGCADAADRW